MPAAKQAPAENSQPSRLAAPKASRPLNQTHQKLVKGYSPATSTDTWNKPSSDILTTSSSLKSTNAGGEIAVKGNFNDSKSSVIQPKPPLQKKSSGFAAGPIKTSGKPLPGGRLIRLQENKSEANQQRNTWAPNPVNLTVNNSLKPSNPKPAAALIKPEPPADLSQSPSPSGASTKHAVLPSITQVATPKPANADVTDHSQTVRRDTPVSPAVSGRSVQHVASPSRGIATPFRPKTAKRESVVVRQHIDPSLIIPEWYANPKITPQTMKGGVAVINLSQAAVTDNICVMTKIDSENVFNRLLESVTEYNVPRFWNEDPKQLLKRVISKNELVIVLDPGRPDAYAHFNTTRILPKCADDLTAKRITEILFDPAKPVYPYFEHPDQPGTWILDLTKIQLDGELHESTAGQVKAVWSYHESLIKEAELLGITKVNSVEQFLETLKAWLDRKRDEPVNWGQHYLQPIELEDAWNHAMLADQISAKCFTEGEFQQSLYAAREAVLAKVQQDCGTPVYITGPRKSGKTWLCAQLTKQFPAATVLTRFCGLTQLTNSLNNLLISLTKQLAVLYGSPTITKDFTRSEERTVMQFIEILNFVSSSCEEPVVLILDGIDNLPQREAIAFITHCQSIPSRVVLVISFSSASPEDDIWFDGEQQNLWKMNPEEEAESGTSQLTEDVENSELAKAIEKLIGNSEAQAELEEAQSDLEKNPELIRYTEQLKEAKDANDLARIRVLTGEVLENFDFKAKEPQKLKKNIQDVRSAEMLRKASAIKDCGEYLKEVEKSCAVKPTTSEVWEQVNRTVSTTQFYVQIGPLSEEHSKSFLRWLMRGKISNDEQDCLLTIVRITHNPLLLRLYANSCCMGFPSQKIADLIQQIQSEVFPEEDLNEGLFRPPEPAHRLIIVVMTSLATENVGLKAVMRGAPLDLVNLEFLIPMTESQRNNFLPNKKYLHLLDAVFQDCYLEAFAQGRFQIDVENLHSFIFRAEAVTIKSIVDSRKTFSSKYQNLVKDLQDNLDKFAAIFTSEHDKDIDDFLENYVLKSLQGLSNLSVVQDRDLEWIQIKELQCDAHPVDAWEEPIVTIPQKEDVAEAVQGDPELPIEVQNNDQSKAQVQSIEEDQHTTVPEEMTAAEPRTIDIAKITQDYPPGNLMCWYLKYLTFLCTVYGLWFKIDDCQKHLRRFETVLVNYDVLMSLFKDFGIDYVLHVCEEFLESMALVQSLNIPSLLRSHVTLTVNSVELLYHFVTSVADQLRVTPSLFATLLMGHYNEDAPLISVATSRLYKRALHEIKSKNCLHMTTMLVEPKERTFLSTNVKRYLQLTAEKYAALQCLSNAKFILSHNCQSELKIWSLTGDFVSVQNLGGKILAVCPQREKECFLAVVEKYSEIGERSSVIYQIDRLKHKMLANIGSKTVLSAWFDQEGTKLIYIEQRSADGYRVVVCMPQTFKVAVEETSSTITVQPMARASFMCPTLTIPHQIDEAIYEHIKAALTADTKKDGKAAEEGDKKKAANTDKKEHLRELDYFVKKDDVYELKADAMASSLLSDSKMKIDLESLNIIWQDVLDKFDARDDIVYPVEEIHSEMVTTEENISRMTVSLIGMTGEGNIIVVRCQYSNRKSTVYFFKLNDSTVSKVSELPMDEFATMALMPTDDFVFSDKTTNLGLTAWHLPSNTKQAFGNEENEYITCLQYEWEEEQILSFYGSKVTVWNGSNKATDGCYNLDPNSEHKEVVASCLQDNWLMTANREGELTLRFDIRKKKATYHLKKPVDWIDGRVIGDHVYIACHVNGNRPSICFLKYKVDV